MLANSLLLPSTTDAEIQNRWIQRSAANCPPLSWTGSVTSRFWKQKTDHLRAHVVILDWEYMHICDRQSITLCARQISLSQSLSVWMSVSFLSIMYVSHEHVYLYTYVIHCWNGCTDMLYYCVIFVILNLKNKKSLHHRTRESFPVSTMVIS